MQTTRQRAILITFLISTLITIAIAIINPAKKMQEAKPTTVTNFICEINGSWSNEHYNISNAHIVGKNGLWGLTYRDSNKHTTYLQRPGEDCRVEEFPIPKE